jgi:hypothetical protein
MCDTLHALYRDPRNMALGLCGMTSQRQSNNDYKYATKPFQNKQTDDDYYFVAS